MSINSPCYVAVFQKKLLIDAQTKLPLLFTPAQIASLQQDISIELFIGTYHSVDYHVIALAKLDAIDAVYETTNLRQLVGMLEEGIWFTVNRAMQLVEWYYAHQFCSRCGAKTERNLSEHTLMCVSCQIGHYPRINPCIMVLITHGDNILLVKSSHPMAKHYTLIAGFIEAGENAEEATHREVLEEVGLHITNLTYSYSQSWPFPHALMLGFTAQYASGQLCLDRNEISDANWYDRNGLAAVTLPGKGTLSRRLIDDWLQAAS